MAKRILTPSGLRKEIERVLKVSQPTIRLALGGDDKTATQRLIRRYALNHGATEVG